MPIDYDFYLRGNPDDMLLKCVEVSHPAWSQVFRYVQNDSQGVRVKHEDGNWYDYTYSPIVIKKGASNEDLEQSLTIGVGDLGEVFPREMDKIRLTEAHQKIRPKLNYREYSVHDLTQPAMSILNLEVSDYQAQDEGTSFECVTQDMNSTRTGLTYNLVDHPLLRGFL